MVCVFVMIMIIYFFSSFFLLRVHERNAVTTTEFEGYKMFNELRSSIREVLDSKDKLPWPVTVRGGKFVYNFWEDSKYVRGVWRRTTFEEYKKTDNIEWEDLMDFGELGKAEGKSWVFSGAVVYNPGNRALLNMSDGAGDARIVREFDMNTKKFVTGANSFEFLKEAKTRMTWVDMDTVLIATDFGEDSMTNSGYPRIVKRWKRGQKLEDAVTLHSGDKTDVSAFGYVSRFAGGPPKIIVGQNTRLEMFVCLFVCFFFLTCLFLKAFTLQWSICWVKEMN